MVWKECTARERKQSTRAKPYDRGHPDQSNSKINYDRDNDRGFNDRGGGGGYIDGDRDRDRDQGIGGGYHKYLSGRRHRQGSTSSSRTLGLRTPSSRTLGLRTPSSSTLGQRTPSGLR